MAFVLHSCHCTRDKWQDQPSHAHTLAASSPLATQATWNNSTLLPRQCDGNPSQVLQQVRGRASCTTLIFSGSPLHNAQARGCASSAQPSDINIAPGGNPDHLNLPGL